MGHIKLSDCVTAEPESLDLTNDDNGTITINVPYNYDDYDTSVTWGTATSGSGTYTISTTGTGGLWDGNSTSITDNYGKISIHGDKGTWDLEERLRTLERALNIPERDYDMEAKHPELADLFEKHLRKVERMLKKLPTVTEYEREVEKHRMWDTLKGPDRNVDSGG